MQIHLRGHMKAARIDSSRRQREAETARNNRERIDKKINTIKTENEIIKQRRQQRGKNKLLLGRVLEHCRKKEEK